MKRILLICSLALLSATLFAQDARTCFNSIPDSVCPLLTAVNRADFIDFLDSKMKAQVTNRLGGKSEMTVLTDDYIQIRMTPQSLWQMKLLPLPGDSAQVIICTVSTVTAPAADSHFRFYTSDWQPLPAADYLPALPTLDDFLLPAAATLISTDEAAPAALSDTVSAFALREAIRQADIVLLKANLQPSQPTLTFHLSTPAYMEQKAADVLTPYLRDAVTFRWENGRFITE